MARAPDIREAETEASEVSSWTCTDCDRMVEADGVRCWACAQYVIDLQSGVFDDLDDDDDWSGFSEGDE